MRVNGEVDQERESELVTIYEFLVKIAIQINVRI